MANPPINGSGTGEASPIAITTRWFTELSSTTMHDFSGCTSSGISQIYYQGLGRDPQITLTPNGNFSFMNTNTIPNDRIYFMNPRSCCIIDGIAEEPPMDPELIMDEGF